MIKSKMAITQTDWQTDCVELKERGAYILQSGQWSDCTFLVGSHPDQVVVTGHKLILAMASPVFEAMFYGGMAERNDTITISDVQPDAFKAMLKYIYTDKLNINSFDEACELCYTANKYMLPHLVKECTKYLWLDLYPKNVCRAYEFSCLFEETVLMNKCIQIISSNTKEVLNDSSFNDININTVIMMFSLDHLNVDSELDLFDAAERYVKAQEKKNAERATSPSVDSEPVEKRQKSPEPSTSKDKGPEMLYEKQQQRGDTSCEESEAEKSDATDAEEVKELPHEPQGDENKTDKGGEVKDKPTIRNAIEKIRFLTLTPQQFAEGPAKSNLLTKSEAFAILMNIVSSASDVPMPAGFSTSRVPRKQLIGGRPSSNVATFIVDTPSPVLVEPMFASEGPPIHNCMPLCGRPPRQDGGFRMASMMNPSLNFGPVERFEPLERHGVELTKIYCQRALLQHTDCLNTSALDCSVTFMVDKNICLLGVQVPTQAPSEESAALHSTTPGYSELLYAHLLDADGARLTYTHYTSRVPYRHLLDIMFNRPVYIQKNKVYKVGIVFNKVGWYPMGRCTQQVAAESVFFNFGIGQTSDTVRDGLIRSIIFTY